MFEKCSEDTVIQCLKDAGCNDEEIDCFLRCRGSGQPQEELALLGRYRDALLIRLHKNQKRIDCLDYLVYRIKKENR